MDPRYTWIWDKVAFYDSKFVTEARVVDLMSTFKICSDGLNTLPCFANNRVFFRLGEKEDNFVFIYEYFLKFGVSFALSNFKSGLLFALSIVISQFHPNIRGFVKSFEIVCGHLSLTPHMFMFFYQMKHGTKVG